MKLQINGKETIIEQKITLDQFLLEKGLSPDSVAVELNGLILERVSFSETALNDGDTLEVLRFVGGG